jgi:indolepyruvate ferredoxin oxidoreductase beta subunit
MSAYQKDPLNLIITGVGGQGNVLISRLIGQILTDSTYRVTIGETYGAQQRGGPVASHVRISKDTQYGALTPEGQADVILGLEPVESLRILSQYGSPRTTVITNTRPIYPMAVSTGEVEYPRLEIIKQSIDELSGKAWYIDASEMALSLGASLLTNMVMAGALVGAGLLPLRQDMFERQLKASFQKERLTLNLQAFRMGLSAIQDIIKATL